MVILADELLYAMGEEVRARTVAVSALADDPRYSSVPGAWPAELPRLGRDPAELLARAPAVVFVSAFTSEEWKAAVRGRVEVVSIDDFTGFDGYLRNLSLIGRAAGAPDAAAELARRFEAERARLASTRPSTAGEVTCLAFVHGSAPASQTTFDDVAKLAGCTNVAAAAGLEGHRRVDAEQVLAWDPDLLVLECGDAACAGVDTMLESAGLRHLAAVRDGHVVRVPAPLLSTTGPRMLELAALLQERVRGRRGPPSGP